MFLGIGPYLIKLFRYFLDFCHSLSPTKIFFFINLAFIVFIFILGFRPGAFHPKITQQNLAYYNNRLATVTGRVCEESRTNIKSQQLTVCALGRVLVTTNLYPVYDYGDFVKVTGRLQTPMKIEGFDYGAYLARYDIYSVMYYPRIKKISGSLTKPQQAYRLLLDFKQRLRSIINSTLPEPEAGLANALLLGYRRLLSKADLQIFARVGLSHLIAISGTHIAILSALIINLFLVLGFRRRQTFIAVFIFLILYPIITGLGASAVRSAIMGSLALLAVYYKRSNSLIKALVFSATLMLIFNPRLLRDDLGFQLSFLALLGIIYIYPVLSLFTNWLLTKIKLAGRAKNIFKIILEILVLTLAVQITILPIMIINFKQLSLIAPLSNILVLWAFPPLLASLIGALILSALIPSGAVLWFSPAYLLLKFIFTVAYRLAQLNFAAVGYSNFNWYWGILYYAILIAGTYFLSLSFSSGKTDFKKTALDSADFLKL